MRLSGKVAVVTGGGSGIGRGIVHCMAREGAIVVVSDIDEESGMRVVREVEKCGGRVGFVQVDVTKPKEIERMFVNVKRCFEKVDILVNNVGVSGRPGMPFTNNTEEDWDLVWAVNVKSLFFTAKAIASYFMKRKEGRIINIASIAGFMPGLMKPPYSVSKMAVVTLTRILAKEFAPYGVTVNAISPGLVWTPLWERLADQLIRTQPKEYAGMEPRKIFEKRVSELVPLNREQTPEDIGWAAVFLASEHARNITGQVLSVDGGVIMH